MGILLVLGIGNSILGDDGVGVHVAQMLSDEPELPPGTEIVDGGTGGLALLPQIAGVESLVILDAVDVGAEPGSVHVLRGDDLYSNLRHLSVHQVGAADLLAAARLTGDCPAEVVLIGVQPACLEPGLGLSPVVAEAVPTVVRLAVEWCRRLSPRPQVPAARID